MITKKDIGIAVGISLATSTVLGVTYLLLPRRYKEIMNEKVNVLINKIKNRKDGNDKEVLGRG